MKTEIKIGLVLILFLAIFLRFWQIDQYPAGLNADEAAYGYNAYSLIQTGKDEFGDPWPIHFKSFGDYKPGGTTYLMLPFVKVFGLNEFAIRLPSLIAGVASVFLIFIFVFELFKNYRLALIAALFLAISPWHIHFSRGAWETNLATTFILLGSLFFYKGLSKAKYFTFSAISFIAAMYTYHTPRLVVPLLGLFLFFVFRKEIRKNMKGFLAAVILGFVLLLPFVFSFFGPAVSARFSGVSVFSDIGPLWEVNRSRGEHQNLSSLTAKILHNKPVIYSLKISQNWLSHFDGSFLFVNGDRIKRSNAPETGEMYIFDIIFVAAGFYFFLKNRPKNYGFVFFWLLVAPVAASLTFQSPNALRSHNMIIPLIIISSYGFYNILAWINSLRKRNIVILLYCCIAILTTWSVGYYLHQYFVHYPKTYAEAWEYGIHDLVDYLRPIKDNYSKVYVTEKYDQPYIIFLFYLKYPPEELQKEVILTPRDKFGFSTVRDFDNYHFENIDWQKLKGTKRNALVCGTDEEIPSDAKVVKTINFLNGKPVFKCAEI